MQDELVSAAKEIFRFRELLKDVIMAEVNTPDERLDKIFPVYEQFVELVESLQPYTANDIQFLLDKVLIKYAQQPFFPVLAGLFVNALCNRYLHTESVLGLNMEKLCFGVIDDASAKSQSMVMEDEETEEGADISFSLDFLGYLLPENKTLQIIGAVGDFCGALMDKNSVLILRGMHGKQFGYEKDKSAHIVEFKP